MLHVIIQFATELLRALVIDEMIVRVRRRIKRRVNELARQRLARMHLQLSRRTRARLLHRMRTPDDSQP